MAGGVYAHRELSCSIELVCNQDMVTVLYCQLITARHSYEEVTTGSRGKDTLHPAVCALRQCMGFSLHFQQFCVSGLEVSQKVYFNVRPGAGGGIICGLVFARSRVFIHCYVEGWGRAGWRCAGKLFLLRVLTRIKRNILGAFVVGGGSC
jgi:hypothetical protein